jgi:hypothetical protein
MRPNGKNRKEDIQDNSYVHVSGMETHKKAGDAQEIVFSYEIRGGEDDDVYNGVESQIVDTMHLFFLTQKIEFNVRLIFKCVIYIPSVGDKLSRTFTMDWLPDELLEMGYDMDGDGSLNDAHNGFKRFFFSESFQEKFDRKIREIIHLNEAKKTARSMGKDENQVSYMDFTEDDILFFFSAPMPWNLIDFKFLNVTFR